MAEEPPTETPDQLRSALEPLRALSSQVGDIARSWAPAAGLPAAPWQADTLIGYAEQVSTLPRLAVDPLRHIVEEQRRLAEFMAAWAEQHRELAEKLAASAEHLRQLSTEVGAVIDPLLAYADRISEVMSSWTEVLRPRGEGQRAD
jgi:hypothetical protein